MKRLSNRLHSLSESQTLQMNKLSRKLKQEGHDIINLSLGEPDFPTPDHIKEGAKKAIDEDYTHYPPVAGYIELRKAIAKKFKDENGLNYTHAEVVVSTGAKQALANIMLALLNPGDEVILPAPYWVSYIEMIKLAEGKVVIIPTKIENDFKLDLDDLEAAITKKTKIFIMCSPSNPTGTVYDKGELRKIAEILARYPDITIVSDEIYEHITFKEKHESIAQFDIVKESTVVVNGVSKGYAMTGWRIGYIGAPLPIAKACEKIQGQITSGASSISQRAAIVALSSGLEDSKKMCAAFKRRRDLILELIKEIPGIRTDIPEGAFYIFPDISYYFGKSVDDLTIKNSNDFCMYLLNEANVAIVTGAAFGDDNCVRISYSASAKEITEAMSRIKTALNKLEPVDAIT
ncbi:MAG: pyridoxal phosphate-dependent aminotransferase [Bacteroidetes bacterium]|nr:pyridoxal phosphate-dependent aminotransferase [Bacteroidota bacterium]